MDERWAYDYITLTDGMIMGWDMTRKDWIYCGGSVAEAVAALVQHNRRVLRRSWKLDMTNEELFQ